MNDVVGECDTIVDDDLDVVCDEVDYVVVVVGVAMNIPHPLLQQQQQQLVQLHVLLVLLGHSVVFVVVIRLVILCDLDRHRKSSQPSTLVSSSSPDLILSSSSSSPDLILSSSSSFF